MLIAIIILALGAIFLLTRANRTAELRDYGVTKEIKEQARTAEPDESAPEPEEFA